MHVVLTGIHLHDLDPFPFTQHPQRLFEMGLDAAR